MLHGPVVDRCEAAEMKGCDAIADGVIAVADGKKDEGLAQIEQGAGRNAPENVRAFADKLDAVGDIPGLGSFGPALKQVVTALRHSSDEGNASAKVAAKSADDQGTRNDPSLALHATPVEDVARWRAGTARPSIGGESCETSLGPSLCERVLIGPAEVSSLVAGGGCTSQLFVFAGDARKPRWSVLVPSNGTLTLWGTDIPLDEAEGLGVATTSDAKIQNECAVLWVAKRR